MQSLGKGRKVVLVLCLMLVGCSQDLQLHVVGQPDIILIDGSPVTHDDQELTFVHKLNRTEAFYTFSNYSFTPQSHDVVIEAEGIPTISKKLDPGIYIVNLKQDMAVAFGEVNFHNTFGATGKEADRLVKGWQDFGSTLGGKRKIDRPSMRNGVGILLVTENLDANIWGLNTELPKTGKKPSGSEHYKLHWIPRN